jgi:hypothetical protein
LAYFGIYPSSLSGKIAAMPVVMMIGDLTIYNIGAVFPTAETGAGRDSV